MKGIKEYLAFNILLIFSGINPILDWLELKFKKKERWKPTKLSIGSTVGTKPESFAKWGVESGIRVGVLAKK